MRPHRLIFVLAVAAACAGLRTIGAMQALPKVGADADITHFGIVTPDIDRTIREFVRVMGFPTPQVSEYPVDMPDGRKAVTRVAAVSMPNFRLELLQPMGKIGPYYEHLQAFGLGIQHTAFNVTASIEELRKGMEQKGGRWVLGAPNGSFAYVDFRPTLGTTFELVRGTGAPGPNPPAIPTDGSLPPLAALPVSHIGFAVTDFDRVAQGFADVLGISAPKAIDYKDSQYPPNSKWNPSAPLRLGLWPQKNAGVELIQSVGGPTPWSEYVQTQKGTAAQHVAINVGDRMDEMIKDLQAKGGQWTNGKPGGNYAYLDFMNTLGLVLELNGTSKSAAK
jgi:catechol 2,3-dioxygenase-like lactoylglutathione lyase family enzyme